MKKVVDNKIGDMENVCKTLVPMDSPEGDNTVTVEQEEWFQALVNDDLDACSRILDGADLEKKASLLNAPLVFREVDVDDKIDEPSFSLSMPLNIAVANGSLAVLDRMFLEEALEFGQQEPDTLLNMIHTLCTIIFFEEAQEEQVCRTYRWLTDHLPYKTLEMLFYQENQHGLRPLELACQDGVAKMIEEILNTPCVYLMKQEKKGMRIFNWYDVTDYERHDFSRRTPGPLDFLTYMDHATHQKPEIKDLLESPFFNKWIKSKTKSTTLWWLLWILVRLLYFTGNILYDMDSTALQAVNQTQTTACLTFSTLVLGGPLRISLLIYLSVHSILILLFDFISVVVHIVRRLKRKDRPVLYSNSNGRKRPKVIYFGYRIIQNINAWVVAVLTYYSIIGRVTEDGLLSTDSLFLDLVKTALPIVSIWPLFYLSQRIPSLGYTIITIEWMLVDLMNFIFIYLIFLIPFTNAFFLLINYNSLDGCYSDFGNYGASLYTVFTMMLNMVSLKDFNIQNDFVLYLMHAVYIFMIAVLLLNFLIALFSNSVNNVNDHKHVLLTIQKLSVTLTIDSRCRWITRRLGYHPHVVEEDGRLYIVTTTQKFQNNVDATSQSVALN